jgi:hypothetical protein
MKSQPYLQEDPERRQQKGKENANDVQS